VFLVHGEPESSEAFGESLRHDRHWNVHIPELGETHQLD
jgi:hypothetical protein